MSTVEELREKLLQKEKRNTWRDDGMITGYIETQHVPTAAEVDSLISAARAEGVAEGKTEALANPISRGTLYVNTGGIGDLPDGQYSIITVLAPDKESEK
jgi:hypothetical protein